MLTETSTTNKVIFAIALLFIIVNIDTHTKRKQQASESTPQPATIAGVNPTGPIGFDVSGGQNIPVYTPISLIQERRQHPPKFTRDVEGTPVRVQGIVLGLVGNTIIFDNTGKINLVMENVSATFIDNNTIFNLNIGDTIKVECIVKRRRDIDIRLEYCGLV